MGTFLVGLAAKWLLPSVGTAVGGYVIVLIRKTLAKIGMELTTAQKAQIREKVQQIILRIEEETRGLDPKPASGDKLDTATRAVMRETGVDVVEAVKLIHEELPKVRAAIAPGAINSGLPGGGRR